MARANHRSLVVNLRVTAANDREVHTRGEYVLYWMIGARRMASNFAVDVALAHCKQLGRPLLVFEPLRAGYRWASDRMHTFVLQGMADNARACEAAGITYLPYVEPEPGAGKGLLAALAAKACVVVTDEQPGFFLPHMTTAAAAKLPVRLELVDGNGLLPLRAVDRWYPTAASFRRVLQKRLPEYLGDAPRARLTYRHGAADAPRLRGWKLGIPDSLSALPIDHRVTPVPYRGGHAAAKSALEEFVTSGLHRYHEERSDPDAHAASGLSPYLHFGHIGAHEVAQRVWRDADWDPSRLVGAKVTGSREGWWDLPPYAESFMDELVTWRELGYVFCHKRADHGTFEVIPDWAKATLAKHARDPRPHRFTFEQLETGTTYDEVWNAAQRELVATGRIQNYLRMLWGKKVLEWSATPRDAFETLVELNNKYAVDGRDPNSYSGILWTFGLFDRPWGPERPIFGTVRYMSSASTVRKLRLKSYLARWNRLAAP